MHSRDLSRAKDGHASIGHVVLIALVGAVATLAYSAIGTGLRAVIGSQVNSHVRHASYRSLPSPNSEAGPPRVVSQSHAGIARTLGRLGEFVSIGDEVLAGIRNAGARGEKFVRQVLPWESYLHEIGAEGRAVEVVAGDSGWALARRNGSMEQRIEPPYVGEELRSILFDEIKDRYLQDGAFGDEIASLEAARRGSIDASVFLSRGDTRSVEVIDWITSGATRQMLSELSDTHGRPMLVLEDSDALSWRVNGSGELVLPINANTVAPGVDGKMPSINPDFRSLPLNMEVHRMFREARDAALGPLGVPRELRGTFSAAQVAELKKLGEVGLRFKEVRGMGTSMRVTREGIAADPFTINYMPNRVMSLARSWRARHVAAE